VFLFNQILSLLPAGVVLYHGIEDNQELAHAGHEGHLGRLSGQAQPQVKLPDHGVAAAGGESCHVEGGPDMGPASPAGSFPAGLSAVAVEGSHPDEGGELASAEGSQLGKAAQQRGGHHGADSQDARKDLFFLAPDGALLDEVIDIVVDVLEPLLHPADVDLDVSANAFFGGHGIPVLLGADHLYDLASTVVEVLELLGLQVLEGPALGADGLGEAGDDPGVDGVGFGQQPHGAGKVADLPGVDDHDGQGCQGQGVDRRPGKAAGGLQDDGVGLKRLKVPDQGSQPLFGVREALKLCGGTHGDHQLLFGDINADEALWFFHGDAPFTLSCGDARSKRSLTTVRVLGDAAWRPRLFNGLKAQDGNGLPRRAQTMNESLPN